MKHRSLFVSNCAVALVILVVVYMLLATFLDYVHNTPLVALTSNERSAMEWIRDNTSLESQFIVLSVPRAWQTDYVAEWFPVLSGRKSLVTAQGLEWIPNGAFSDMVNNVRKIKKLQQSNPDELAGYVDSHYDRFQYIAIFIPSASLSYGGFVESGRYRVVYNDKSALMLERIGFGEQP
jgi:hypothetical protein